MPYIIETGRAGHRELPIEAGDRYSRTAVATLDEACEFVRLRTHEMAHPLPESGGTVGPLPDGTVIEVRPIAFSSLGGMAGLRASDLPTDGEILAAFNAA